MTGIQFRFRPLRWAGPSTPAEQRRSRGTFRSTYDQTLDLLDQELYYLDARDVVIEADFREQDIRRDGLPRGNARQPQHPGVRLFFGSVHGPLMYATDAYEWWQHNLRGIALGLEALRAVDRYGVTKRGEQYTGWKAIANEPAPMTVQEALDFVAAAGDASLAEKLQMVHGLADLRAPVIARVYRRAARSLHPDTGGTEDAFKRLVEAVAVLRRGPDA